MSKARFSTFFTVSEKSEFMLYDEQVATFSFFTCNFYQVGLLRKMQKRDLKSILVNYFSIVLFSLKTGSK